MLGARNIVTGKTASMPDVHIINLEPKTLQNKIGDIHAPGLQRNVLTPDGKRWQLWGKGVKGHVAEAIITDLYGPQL